MNLLFSQQWKHVVAYNSRIRYNTSWPNSIVQTVKTVYEIHVIMHTLDASDTAT